MAKNNITACILLQIVFTVDIFFLCTGFDDISWLFVGSINHLLLLILIDMVWSTENNSKWYYLYILACFICIQSLYKIVCCLENSYIGDLCFIGICLVSLFVNYYVSFNIRQLTILNANTSLLIALSMRENLIDDYGWKDSDSIGITTFLIVLGLILSIITSSVMLVVKEHTSNTDH